ncbi:AGC family protein kinase [Trichomonas vaginalis G3]|uniref:AGC family protein kinase n=1 Tax=Trichomonas vaginalis (strain ATCC PRA-98 / G3) TaxID=412133 RepID=A2FKH7_TRIV3|nr:protein serine/threonine kinase protein [Trichomonas vaginalis G3]EAX94589.1 AGC family protein kinase [Trichomonas vaginalis G3]KAI5542789.1 protein serine/threonine kinase protein [Trichomonas vaginalis G3]|eukprot:XP_001307519.1 AGC family protein kinase [Trichomonas vaginalis G3]
MNLAELEFFKSQGIEYQSTIAQGGFGVVFYVYSTHYHSFFALKKIPDVSFNESEIECIKQIDDPHIVSLYQYYKFDNSIYLLMEYCPSDLEKYLKSNRHISEIQLQKYIYDAVKAIHQCHAKGIAHCDIKPSNFMFDKYGRLKIGDFGLSTSMSELVHSNRGTPVFMAPETFMKNQYCPIKADIWSLGVIIYYMATLQFPFFGETRSALIQNIIRTRYNDDSVEDGRLREVISSCLDPNPDNRLSTEDILKMPYFVCQNQESCLPLLRKGGISKSCDRLIKPSPSFRSSLLHRIPFCSRLCQNVIV